MPNTTAIESLQSFAVAHNELQFAQLCTAALQGEEWAVERVSEAIGRLAQFAGTRNNEVNRVYVLRSTNTTRPDGAIARGSIEV